jgi:RNA polymerase sigma-70 factor (ECF subfamily)
METDVADDNPNDAELVARTLAGDRDAFGRLYDRHARLVRAVVLAVSSDWSAAEDMTQESFLRAYRTLASLREPERVGPWLVGIARQVARERRRSAQRNRLRFSSELVEPSCESNGKTAIESRDLVERVMLRLAELPEEERLAVHAYFLAGERAVEAADRLNLSRSGFYALVERAVAKLAIRPNKTEVITKAVE